MTLLFTFRKPFYPNGKQNPSIQAEFMGTGGRYPYYNSLELDCGILGLPYKGNQSTMYIILPNNSNRQKLIDLQSRLTSDLMEDIISRMTLKTSVVVFPKLHIDKQINLRDALRQLGVRSLFSPQHSDLSLISSYDPAADGITTGAVNYQPLAPSNQVIGPSLTSGLNTQPIESPVTRGDSRRQLQSAYPAVQGLTSGYVSQSRRQSQGMVNDNLQNQLIFSRVGDDTKNTEHVLTKRQVTYKVESGHKNVTSLRFKDFILNKRIFKKNPDLKKPKSRGRRQVNSDPSYYIKQLDLLRQTNLANPGLFADDVLHRVNLIVNERGTEAGAGKENYLIYLNH